MNSSTVDPAMVSTLRWSVHRSNLCQFDWAAQKDVDAADFGKDAGHREPDVHPRANDTAARLPQRPIVGRGLDGMGVKNVLPSAAHGIDVAKMKADAVEGEA